MCVFEHDSGESGEFEFEYNVQVVVVLCPTPHDPSPFLSRMRNVAQSPKAIRIQHSEWRAMGHTCCSYSNVGSRGFESQGACRWPDGNELLTYETDAQQGVL